MVINASDSLSLLVFPQQRATVSQMVVLIYIQHLGLINVLHSLLFTALHMHLILQRWSF